MTSLGHAEFALTSSAGVKPLQADEFASDPKAPQGIALLLMHTSITKSLQLLSQSRASFRASRAHVRHLLRV